MLASLIAVACSDAPRGSSVSGPVADVAQELAGGNGIFLGSPDGFPLPDGFVDHEYVAAGVATDYVVDGPLGDDGRWTFAPGGTAAYRTRVVVRRPSDRTRASGTVVVEWLNVSGGVDANPEYVSLAEEVVRRGHVWVGVSAQLIGVEGGPVLVTAPGGEGIAGRGLKSLDPERYGTLEHPGDGFSFDIFTQVARAVRRGGALLGGIEPVLVIAAGESQSAFALTTYYDGVQPLTKVFDGFFLHSRGAASLPLVGPGRYADLVGSIGSSIAPILRDDLDAPVVDLQAEGDLTGILRSSASRQPDDARFRLWEVAGTAHADRHLLGATADQLDCGVPINDGPLHVVAKAALRALEDWLRTGAEPPRAPRIALSDAAAPAVLRDADGIALGGLRTPPVDVPVEVLSGAPGPTSDVICLLLGSTTPLPDERVAELYASRADYLARYEAATDAAITAGYVLPEDRAALLGYARPSRVAQ